VQADWSESARGRRMRFGPTGSGKTLAQRSGCRLADLASNCRRASAFSSDLASAQKWSTVAIRHRTVDVGA
jgi:hypothetical protein